MYVFQPRGLAWPSVPVPSTGDAVHEHGAAVETALEHLLELALRLSRPEMHPLSRRSASGNVRRLPAELVDRDLPVPGSPRGPTVARNTPVGPWIPGSPGHRPPVAP